MKSYVEFHLGRTIALSALSELLNHVSAERFQGFVRVNEAGQGRFVLSLPRGDGADVALFTLIREDPSRLYAEPNVACLGEWALDVYTGEIAARTGALVSTAANRSLHAVRPRPLPTFAAWLLDDEQRASSSEELHARYASAIPLPLRGVVSFR